MMLRGVRKDGRLGAFKKRPADLAYDISAASNVVSGVTDDEDWSGTGTPADEWSQKVTRFSRPTEITPHG